MQTEIGVRNQGSKNEMMVDEEEESSGSVESEDDGRGDRIEDRAAYRSLPPFKFKQTD